MVVPLADSVQWYDKGESAHASVEGVGRGYCAKVLSNLTIRPRKKILS